MNLDLRIFYIINDFARDTPWLHSSMAAYANDGVLLFVGFLLGGWWLARKSGDPTAITAAMWTPLGVLVALLVYDPIAVSVNETRPCNALHDIVVLHCNTDGGFPSIHTVIAAAVAAGLWLVNRRLGIVAAVAAVLMAFARVYVGAHYPRDVLAGLALGAVVSVAGYFLFRPLLRRFLGVIDRTRLRVILTTSRDSTQHDRRAS
ncbi:phosphatase PAP2 family protein [Mycolicibacterium sp. CBMA 226]|uniref:phosphatase PAP2 family protein n=1 Tax=Mycolicibacterium sp. CBMA 226 TaxID=2606611 RepID=UPI0012DE4678|nr:phosphatase PAP2 family protein [Mycolicibacterium sp. CBMA 226]MUL79453.1 phosphatase PAP2 family protein [Mycolicibacterium sp. CBMA 226]